jgi:recombination protein RecT
LGAEPVLRHKPLVEDDGGEVTHAYAVAFFLDGSTQFEVMTRAQLEHVRKSSRSGASGPWAQHFEEMARKTVVRRLAKYLPLSPELAAGVALADQDEETDAKAVKANVRDALDMNSDAVYVKATVEKPRPEAPAKRESVAEAKAKARQSAAAKPSPEPVKPDAGNRYRAAVAKLVAKGMTPEAAEDVATALFDGLESGAQHERVVAQSLREGLKVDVQDDAPEALLALIEGLS